MKSLFGRFISLVLLFICFSAIIMAQATSIESIKKNPGRFEGNEVEIKGLVIQYVEGKGSTSYYLIKGDYGGIIRVNTSEPAPETNKKYIVKGIVYIDNSTQTPFISEKSKTSLETVTSTPQTQTTTPPPSNTQVEPVIEEEKDNTLLYLLLALLAVLIGFFIYYQMRRKPQISEPGTAGTGEKAGPIKEQEPVYSTDNDYKTIKIVTSNPKTLKFIPGKLIITDGADKGKEFRIAGFPSPEGFVVSIGRKEVKGDRAYAHIQLKEMTVSREQAEIIYRDSKLFIKNLSETNFTQLNGAELQLGQMTLLTSNSTIRTGEVEFQYKL